MRKHTPGPWSINQYTADYEVVGTDAPLPGLRQQAIIGIGKNKFKAVSIGTGSGQVAIIPLDESNLDNAKLITAAPDMAEALKNIVSALDDGEIPSVDNARAALAKAGVE